MEQNLFLNIKQLLLNTCHTSEFILTKSMEWLLLETAVDFILLLILSELMVRTTVYPKSQHSPTA